MDKLSRNQLISLIGDNESDLKSMIQTEFGKESLEYLAQWANITQLSLKANRIILSQCLVTDDENHILCRFCGEGIPNWKQENSREHVAECPINYVSTALLATKELQKDILGINNAKKEEENNNTMSGNSMPG
jgi:hypothetical protein